MGDEARFDEICRRVARWPSGCSDNAEQDVMLKAGKEAFRPGSNIIVALKMLYVRHAMLRPIIDMLVNAFSDELSAKSTR